MYQFLGMDKEQWEIANAVASCFGAAATLAAVVVSLWLAQRTDKLSLKLTAGERVFMTPGSSYIPRYVAVSVTNTGRRPAKITGIGWKVGKSKSAKSFIQLTGRDAYSSPLPSVLADGEEAQWFFPIEDWLADWPRMLGTEWRELVPTMRVWTSPTASEPFEVPIEAGLRDLIGTRCREVELAGGPTSINEQT